MAEKSTSGSAERPVIEPQKNGPLKVSGLGTFLDARGQAIATKPAIFLCRCGGSGNKPFCDGTHKRIGFSDEKSEKRTPDKLHRYEGRDITILDNRGICAHVGECTDGLPPVWRMGVEPWIDPDGAARDVIVATVKKCPSGALSYVENGKAQTEYHSTPEIQVTRDGPYHVRGGVGLEGVAWGEGASREHYALCRCGQSRNKPFCDGSHYKAEFEDEGISTGQK